MFGLKTFCPLLVGMGILAAELTARIHFKLLFKVLV